MSGACLCLFFFKQKTSYERRISDWSSDVCSSDLADGRQPAIQIKHQILDPIRRVSGEAINAQRAVLDAAFRNCTAARGATEPGKAIGETHLAVSQPDIRVGRDR